MTAYSLFQHWIANNIFGLSFAIKGIEMLSLNSVTNGCILLGGLFLYDVFWVFGTDVMVTVAKTFDAPIKFIFPMDFLEKGLWGSNFALLGLGDVVLPGIFIALLLRFEQSKSTGSRLYFTSTCVAYLAGLILTVVVMHVFDAAQPALLYLVPACLGVPLLLATVKGDIPELFRYEDHPSDEKQQSGTKTKSD
jgi:minor histocompatibility antigen H13